MKLFKVRNFLALAAILMAGVFTPASAQQRFDTAAPYAIMVEAGTGEVLFEKNADVTFPPASMAKMMTTYLAFEMIERGEISLEDTTIVSDDTWREWGRRGSTMFLRARDKVTIADLLRGIIVQSGNDATVVLAEALAGSEGLFVDWMNAKAYELGMRSSTFMNSNGWPVEGQMVSARDLATLAYHMIKNYPGLYAMYAEKSFSYGLDVNGDLITQRNRNPLLFTVNGADGLKTGHTEEAGYALTGSAVRGERRIIIVVSGLTSERQRAAESQRLLEYGFRAYKSYALFKAGDVVDNAAVWLGDEGTVPLVVDQDVTYTLSRAARNRMQVKVVYQSPIPAPIEAGQDIAHLVISTPGAKDRIVPLSAGQAVGEIGPFGRLGALVKYLIFGNTATN
ncbi:MAG: D-alanyl-D-alanine carboxypeptidase [Proteobacteria bacterium]|nr:D-alanyl-D-alanine carboxypeptidase [Pseudomonadota bacterium]